MGQIIIYFSTPTVEELMKSAQVVMAACHPVIHDEDEMI
jgi:hypothetical protein